MKRSLLFMSAFAVLFAPAVARADNTSLASAYSLAVGGTPVEAAVNSVGPVDRWYSTRVSNGRSYCAETQGGVSFDTSGTAGSINTTLTIVLADGITVVASNDDAAGIEPAANTLSRACFRSTLADQTIIYIKVSSAAGLFNTRMRFVETTRYSNWFFLGGDYDAYVILRNASNASLVYTIEWRNAAGAIVGTASGTLAANGGAFHTTRTVVTTAASGTVQIGHNGADSALIAVRNAKTLVVRGRPWAGKSFRPVSVVSAARWAGRQPVPVPVQAQTEPGATQRSTDGPSPRMGEADRMRARTTPRS
jgi:hypothetical protein